MLSNLNSTSYKTDTPNKLHSLLEEKIFTIFFNTSRIDSSNISDKSSIVLDFLNVISSFKSTFPVVTNYFLDLYKKIILYTRDIYFGLGERSYSYLLLTSMHSIFPEYTPLILKSFFFKNNTNNNIHPIGSWCDLKFLTSFIISHNILSPSQQKTIIFHIVNLVNLQLFFDISNVRYSDSFIHPRYTISNVAKWIPREKNNSILSDFFYLLASNWSSKYDSSIGHQSKKYRRVVSDLNSMILTYETHSNPSYPSTIHHQFNNLVFSNPYLLSPDSQFSSSYSSLSPGFFVSHMFSAINNNDVSRIHFLNFKWSSFINSYSKLHVFYIPVIDMTLFHFHLPSFYNMLGLAIYIAFISSYGKKILISSEKPIWLDLSSLSSLHSVILEFSSLIRNSNSIFSYDLNSSLTLIQDSILSDSQPSHNTQVVIFAYRHHNFIFNIPFFHQSPFSISFWNISQSTFDFDFIKSIKNDFYFLNGFNINSLFYSHFNSLFLSSDVFKYFNFLFNNPRYSLDN